MAVPPVLGNEKSPSDFGAHLTFNSGKKCLSLIMVKEGMTVLEESEEPRNDEL